MFSVSYSMGLRRCECVSYRLPSGTSEDKAEMSCVVLRFLPITIYLLTKHWSCTTEKCDKKPFHHYLLLILLMLYNTVNTINTIMH